MSKTLISFFCFIQLLLVQSQINSIREDADGVTFDFIDTDRHQQIFKFIVGDTRTDSAVTIGPKRYSITKIDDKIQWVCEDTKTHDTHFVLTPRLEHDIRSNLGTHITITIAGHTIEKTEAWWKHTLRLEPPTDDIKKTIVTQIVKPKETLKKSFSTKYYDTILPLLIEAQQPNQLLFVTAVEELRTKTSFADIKSTMDDIYDIFFGKDKMPFTEVNLPYRLLTSFKEGYGKGEWKGKDNPWESPWKDALTNAYVSVRRNMANIRDEPKYKKQRFDESIRKAKKEGLASKMKKKIKKSKDAKKIKSKAKPITESQVGGAKTLAELMGGAKPPPKAFSEYDDIYDEIYYDNMQSYANHIGYQKEILNNNNYSVEWILFAIAINIMSLLVICCVIGIIGSVIGYFCGQFMNKNSKRRDVITLSQSDNEI